MQIVINIDDDLYKSIIGHRCKIKYQQFCDYEDLKNAIEDGTPLPRGHGKLIDADALEKKMCDREEELGDDRALWESSAVSVALNMFASTIIEADRSEKE